MDTCLRGNKIARDKEKKKIFLIVLISCLAGFLMGIMISPPRVPALLPFTAPPEIKISKDTVALIYVEGVIADAESIIRKLKEAERGAYGALVIRINSPGGLVSPTWEIYRTIREIRQKKPVVASIDTIGASGGYYIASAADKIIVTPGSITGSIGVIIQTWNLKKIFDRVGVKSVVIKSGKMKDSLAPYKDLSPEEREYLQSLVMQMYRRFLEDVADGRGMNVSEIKPYADGRIISGEDAVAYGLADRLGTLEDAIREAARLAGIKGKPKVRRLIEEVPWFEKFFKTFAGKTIESMINIISPVGAGGPYFAYLCKGFEAGGE